MVKIRSAFLLTGISVGRSVGPLAETGLWEMLAPCLTLTFTSITLLVWQTHGFEETHATFLHTDLLKLLVKKCSKGTGFSKTWLLRDLEILSIMLYSSKKEINTLTEHGDLELDERGDQEEELDRPVSSPGEAEQKKLDPLESLDEPTRICFLVCSLAFMCVQHRHQRSGFSLAQAMLHPQYI